MPPYWPKEPLTLVMRPDLSWSTYFFFLSELLPLCAPNFLMRAQHLHLFSKPSFLGHLSLSITLLPKGITQTNFFQEVSLIPGDWDSLLPQLFGYLIFQSTTALAYGSHWLVHISVSHTQIPQQQNFSLLLIWTPRTHIIVVIQCILCLIKHKPHTSYTEVF